MIIPAPEIINLTDLVNPNNVFNPTDVGGEVEDDWTVDGVKLCPEQIEAVKRIRAFNPDAQSKTIAIVLTGKAGSGKSTVIKYLVKSGYYTVTATTGKAAIGIGGYTVDRVFKFNRFNWMVKYGQLTKIMEKSSRKIIIDEASMIGKNMAESLYSASTMYDRLLILVGDWAQAAPVKDEWPFEHELFKYAEKISLLENHRQEKGDFYSMLNELRDGCCRNAASYFAPRIADDERYIPKSAVRLIATNKATDEMNDRKFKEFIQGRPFLTLSMDAWDQVKQEYCPADKYPDESKREAIIRDARLAHNTPIAIGARVLITWNDPGKLLPYEDVQAGAISDMDYVNGDSGTVLSFIRKRKDTDTDIQSNTCESMEVVDPHDGKVAGFVVTSDPDEVIQEGDIEKIRVHLDRTGEYVDIPRRKVEFDLGDPANPYAMVCLGFPLALGYAVTIHKSQGMTIPDIWVDVRSICKFPTMESRHGLLYVALSRVPDVSGLYLKNWSNSASYTDPRTVKYFAEEGEAC